MAGVVSSEETIPEAIVAATFNERKAPTKFNTPATITATLGGIAPVATVVAMALVVSWKPLVKSKAKATATTIAIRIKLLSIKFASLK